MFVFLKTYQDSNYIDPSLDNSGQNNLESKKIELLKCLIECNTKKEFNCILFLRMIFYKYLPSKYLAHQWFMQTFFKTFVIRKSYFFYLTSVAATLVFRIHLRCHVNRYRTMNIKLIFPPILKFQVAGKYLCNLLSFC